MNSAVIALFVCLGIFITGSVGRPRCPPWMIPRPPCFFDPCKDYRCHNPPNLTCRRDSCDDCRKKWFNDNGVETKCDSEVSY
ncbi:hypothetical protein DPMN_101926 [Dreissena polymorpha]|uniref:Uncharacterized protein n=1 Tax=Dreissena polymorpha TaxID=45954 RepID=A0A9D4LJL4_DREPO|nr:hypothetical protein DPMN_101926 [Dreissena polymorpha]